MRVLHLIDSGGLYGAETVLLELAAHQMRLGHHAAVVSMGTDPLASQPFESAAESRGLGIHRVRMAAGPDPRGIRELVDVARRERADVLHSHGYKPNILLGFLPRRLRRVPLVATVHGFTYAGGLNRMALYRWLDLRALARCDRVVLVHAGMTTDPALNRLHDPRWRVIENGIAPPQPVRPFDDADPIARHCGRRPVLGAIGRLSCEKGLHNLLAAFHRLVRSGVDGRLLLLGEGPERNRIQRLADALDIRDRVMLPGFVDAGQYLRLLDVLVLPSLTEGLPLVLLEAMQAGIPVVASRVGGIPEVLQGGRCGVLVPPGDVDALTAALGRLLDDRIDAAAIAARGRAAVRERYSTHQMTARYLELYRELVDEQMHDGSMMGAAAS